MKHDIIKDYNAWLLTFGVSGDVEWMERLNAQSPCLVTVLMHVVNRKATCAVWNKHRAVGSYTCTIRVSIEYDVTLRAAVRVCLCTCY